MKTAFKFKTILFAGMTYASFAPPTCAGDGGSIGNGDGGKLIFNSDEARANGSLAYHEPLPVFEVGAGSQFTETFGEATFFKLEFKGLHSEDDKVVWLKSKAEIHLNKDGLQTVDLEFTPVSFSLLGKTENLDIRAGLFMLYRHDVSLGIQHSVTLSAFNYAVSQTTDLTGGYFLDSKMSLNLLGVHLIQNFNDDQLYAFIHYFSMKSEVASIGLNTGEDSSLKLTLLPVLEMAMNGRESYLEGYEQVTFQVNSNLSLYGRAGWKASHRNSDPRGVNQASRYYVRFGIHAKF